MKKQLSIRSVGKSVFCTLFLDGENSESEKNPKRRKIQRPSGNFPKRIPSWMYKKANLDKSPVKTDINPYEGYSVGPCIGKGNFMQVYPIHPTSEEPTKVLKTYLVKEGHFKSGNKLALERNKVTFLKNAFKKVVILDKAGIPHLPILNTQDDAFNHHRLIMPLVQPECILSKDTSDINKIQVDLMIKAIKSWSIPGVGIYMIDPKAENLCKLVDPQTNAETIGFLDVLDSHEADPDPEEISTGILQLHKTGYYRIGDDELEKIIAAAKEASDTCEDLQVKGQIKDFVDHISDNRSLFKEYSRNP